MSDTNDLVKLARDRGYLFEEDILNLFESTHSEKADLLYVYKLIKDMGIEIRTGNEATDKT